MKSLLNWVYGFATAIGGPGLFLIAYLDSSFLSFPQANDLLIIVMVAKYPEWMAYYAGLSTLGSLLGCLSIYFIARKGGEAFLRKRMKASRVEWGINLFRRYGVLAVLVPSILPPPAPFKLFVLIAGVAGMPVWAFAASILAGRGARYFGIGLLTVWYGERAMNYLEENGRTVALAVAGAVFVLVLVYFLARRLRQAPGAAAAAGNTEDAGL
jgi:membrane protein YqaA with SNARE-associated domain